MRVTHIAVDNRMSRSSGIGTSLRNLTRRLAADHAGELSLTLLGGDPVPGTQRRSATAKIFSLAEQLEIPRLIPRSADVFWCPNYNAPFVSRGKLVVGIHDACHLALPEFFGGRIKQAYSRMLFANVGRRAARVVTVSHFSASEITRLAGISPDRIEVIYNGVDDAWREPVNAPRPLAEPYILYVGNVKPHKNLGGLLEAFSLLSKRIPHTLAIVGKREGFITPDRGVIAAAERLGARVRFSGEVSDDALRAWYAHSDLLVFPSLYEGFGLPPLEAMAAGIPVAASNAASIPEICGDAAQYFQPESVEDMAAVIDRTLHDTQLRAQLVELGKRQAGKYSWDDTSSRLAALFTSLGD